MIIKSLFGFFQAKDIFKLHDEVCPRSCMPGGNDLQLSLDGVSESKSTSVSLDVYSVKMRNCKAIFPVRIIRPLGKYRGINNKDQLRLVLEDVTQHHKCVRHFLADNQKRSMAKNSLGHSSWYPCEYCFSRGVPLTTKTGGVKKTKITFGPPARQTANQEQEKRLKTSLTILNI